MSVSSRRIIGAAIASVVLTGLAPGEAIAFDLCAEVGAAKVIGAAPASSPLAATARGVWRKVYAAVYGATGRRTEMTILGEASRTRAGEEFPPYAAICQASKRGDPPVMIATWGLLELLRKERLYDANFLAMVFGHELGHRINDFDAAGRFRASGPAMEARADSRGAFFAASAGFSTRRLACDDVMDLFLNVEAGVDQGRRARRRESLAEVLLRFDVYESLYEAASALAFWDTRKARRLLSWIDFSMEDRVEPIAEFKVLQAQTLMMDAIDGAPWLGAVEIPGSSAAHLRCTPVFPAHTAFWDEALFSLAPKEEGAPRRGADPDLTKAEQLLSEALELGAGPLPVHSTMACVHFYQGDFDEAARSLERAERALPERAPGAVVSALKANGALVRWGAWMARHPAPAVSDVDGPGGQRAWGKSLRRAASDFRGHRDLSALLKALTRYPTVTVPKPVTGAASGTGDGGLCRGDGGAVDYSAGPSIMPPIPPMPRGGGCPCGWSPLHRLPDEESGRRDAGVTTCVPAGWAVGLRYVDVHLPESNLALRMLLHDDLDGPLAHLKTWESSCKTLLRRGVSDAGQVVFVGLCPALGARKVVLIGDDSCRVRRAVVVDGRR